MALVRSKCGYLPTPVRALSKQLDGGQISGVANIRARSAYGEGGRAHHYPGRSGVSGYRQGPPEVSCISAMMRCRLYELTNSPTVIIRSFVLHRVHHASVSPAKTKYGSPWVTDTLSTRGWSFVGEPGLTKSLACRSRCCR